MGIQWTSDYTVICSEWHEREMCLCIELPHLFYHEILEVQVHKTGWRNYLGTCSWILNYTTTYLPTYRYIYETSRKHPFLYGPTILTMSACYETAIQSCCQERNKTECFQIKVKYLYVNCYLESCSAECGLWTNSTGHGQRVGNAESEALLQTY